MANNYRADVPNSNDFGLAANWGSALAANQTLVLNYDVAGITTNLGFSGTDFAGIVFGNDKRIPIGASGSPLQAEVNQTSTGIVRDFGYGDKYLSPGGGAKVMYRVELSPSRPTVYGLSTGISFALVLGNLAQCTVLDTFSIDNTTGQVIVCGGSHTVENKSSDVPALVYIVGGKTKWKRDFGTMYVAGGEVELELDDTVTAGGAVYILGGRVTTIKGDLGNVYLYGGVLDKSKMLKAITVAKIFEAEAGTEILEPGSLRMIETATRVTYGRGAKKVQS
jgi:hypothetical protein